MEYYSRRIVHGLGRLLGEILDNVALQDLLDMKKAAPNNAAARSVVASIWIGFYCTYACLPYLKKTQIELV